MLWQVVPVILLVLPDVADDNKLEEAPDDEELPMMLLIWLKIDVGRNGGVDFFSFRVSNSTSAWIFSLSNLLKGGPLFTFAVCDIFLAFLIFSGLITASDLIGVDFCLETNR